VIAILSNALDATADFFQERLEDRGVAYVRIDTDQLPRITISHRLSSQLAETSLLVEGVELSLDSLSSIYYRRPKPPDIPEIANAGLKEWIANEYRKAWGGILAGAGKLKWVNHPLAISGAGYKPEQLKRAAQKCLQIPSTLITSDPLAAERFCRDYEWDVVVKPIGHGEVRGETPESDQLVYTSALEKDQAGILERVRVCPTLFQQRIHKALDLRVTVVENECIAVALHSQERDISTVDCRRDSMQGMRYSLYRLPENVARRLVELTRSYGLYFAAIDMALDDQGEYVFFEINPAGQWAWLEEIAGAPISDALISCLT